ncbi:CRTAC1 family protein [Natrialbaceae archaeon A-CW3]
MGVAATGCATLRQDDWTPKEFDEADEGEESLTGTAGEQFAFTSRPAGLDYRYEDADTDRNKAIISNAGVFAADFDRDGWTDVLATGGSKPVLFENDGGTFHETDLLPDVDGTIRAAHWFDARNTGYPDLLLLRDDDTPVFLENDTGEFSTEENAVDIELNVPMGATSADYTGNGYLDLFIYQNGDWETAIPDGNPRYDAKINDDNGNPDYLFRNDGGEFELAEDAGIKGTRWTLAASSIDLTGNGEPDIHTGNDFNYDVIYLNQGDGTFEQIVLPEETNRHAMSSEVADLTNNGRPDVFVTNIYYPDWAVEDIMPGRQVHAGGNNVISSRGNGSFELTETDLGLYEGGWGWDVVVDDFTNNGYPDIIQTTRVMTFTEFDTRLSPDQIEQLRTNPYYRLPVIWEQESAGVFTNLDATAVGFVPMDSRSIISLDSNHNGKLDLVMGATDIPTGFDGDYRLYENTAETGNAIQLEILGVDESLAGAIGAVVTVEHDGRNTVLWIHDRQGYLSQKPHVRHVGIGSAESAGVTIEWRDGTVGTIESVTANTRTTITPEGIVETIRLEP